MTSTETTTTTQEPGLANGDRLGTVGATPDTTASQATISASSIRPANGTPSPTQHPQHHLGPEAHLEAHSVVIEPSTSWVALQPRELWAYRELLYFLTWRDIKIRYKQSVLGAAWAIIQPLVTMLIFTALLGRINGAAQHNGDVPFALSTYAALVPWTFFSSAVSNSGNSLVGSANLISKVYFPRMLVPAAAVAASMLDFAIAFGFGLPLCLLYGRLPSLSANLLLLPVLIVLLLMLGLGAGMWMSALNVKYRDIRYALPFIMQIGMFASPVFFRLDDPSLAKWRNVLLLNPITGILEGFRSALFGLPINWGALGFSALISSLLLVYALYAFKRMESSFADII